MTKHSENTKPSNSTKPVLANRILKFRAWVRNGIMVNVVSIDFNNEFITWDDNQHDRCIPPNKCYEIETFDDIVLMEFTGIKDNKGIDIYEGDVIEKHFEKYEVLFHNCEWVFTKLKDYYKEQFYKLNFFDENNFEIIGNIYENPELTQSSE